jgi:formylglycine-generating enzyme required for sulfatase activity
MRLTLIPAGEFIMGAPEFEERDIGSLYTAAPDHRVRITQSFYLGVHEVTQEQYETVMGHNPSRFKGQEHPVEQVSWQEAVEFCEKLSSLPCERAAAKTYRLPTEAEWEYACRAGTRTHFHFGDNDSSLAHYAWYRANSDLSTHPVGKRLPNNWGLYDMQGNVAEWCGDWYGWYTSDEVTDPQGLIMASFRVFRGGTWTHPSRGCWSVCRNGDTPDSVSIFYGFRVVAVPIEGTQSNDRR